MHIKLFAVGMTLLLGCAVPTVLTDLHHATAARAQQDADTRSADRLTLARELPATPPDVVSALVDLVAEGGATAAEDGCLLFDTPAAVQFAIAYRVRTCQEAMNLLHDQVTDPGTYADDLTVPATAWAQFGATATVNGCAASWSGLFTDTPVTAPGPLPGQMAVRRLDGYGWQITSYEPC